MYRRQLRRGCNAGGELHRELLRAAAVRNDAPLTDSWNSTPGKCALFEARR